VGVIFGNGKRKVDFGGRKLKYESAYPRQAESQAEKILDLLSMAVGFRCSFAWGSKILFDEPCNMWQVMHEIGQTGQVEKFFQWYCVNRPESQWHKNILDAAHAFLLAWREWEALGEPKPYPGWEDE